MRPSSAVAISVGCCALGAGLVACFDLLHSTSDVRTACEIDAASTACGPPDLCSPTPAAARLRAERACAWLGACETPMGRNAFGTCMVEALLAFDCASNPSHRAKGVAAQQWACLAGVRSCAAVEACVFPAGAQGCKSPGDYTGCGTAGDDAASNAAVRIECTDGGQAPYASAHGESCALWGRTCADDGTAGACSASPQPGCRDPGCYPGGGIHWCTDAGDVGIDCTSNGAQRCDAFPTHDSARWVACVAEGDAGGICAPDASASCSGGVAVSCPSGVLESIDCDALLDVSGACRAGNLDPPFDWTSACAVTPGRCLSDSCDGGTLTGCARGAPFSTDCIAQGLGACRIVATDLGSGLHAACGAR